MRWIQKGAPPPELTAWLHANPKGVYNDLNTTLTGRNVRRAIRCAALAEQGCLCAYCCARIDGSTSHNEHVVPQSADRSRTTDFTNIVASCNARNQCGDAHKNQQLPLTPLNTRCKTDLQYFLSGRVKGTTQDAKETIRILKLDGRSLRGIRKSMVDTLIYVPSETLEGLHLLDDDLLEILRDDMQRDGDEGCLSPYGPILANIIDQLLT
ncbi:MAG: TIGR02646 family protein [Magnetococcales bacterium]|nr:TIGR02646 family protein [Magnetococcales bacterium]